MCFIPSGYGFVDFDSPAAAQKAVATLKTSGVQAQMAKVRLHCRLILISHQYKSLSFTLCPPSGYLINLKLILKVLHSRFAWYTFHNQYAHWLWSLNWIIQEVCAENSLYLCNYCMCDKSNPCTSLWQPLGCCMWIIQLLVAGLSNIRAKGQNWPPILQSGLLDRNRKNRNMGHNVQWATRTFFCNFIHLSCRNTSFYCHISGVKCAGKCLYAARKGSFTCLAKIKVGCVWPSM